MNNYTTQAAQLEESLQLSLPPVALAFADELPAGVQPYGEVAPAGCYFWQEAAQRVFSTTAKDHELCSIGVHTHNLAGASASQPVELMTTLEAMQGLGLRARGGGGWDSRPGTAGPAHGLRAPCRFSHGRRCGPTVCPRPAEPDLDRSGGACRRGHPAGDGQAGLRGLCHR